MKKRKFRIGQIKQSQQPQKYSKEWIAQHAKRAMDYLAPLIRAKNISPIEALVLVTGIMDRNITGKERWMSEDEIYKVCVMITEAWRQGLFAPCSTYPHTLEQTLAAWNDESEK
jgi:hypothetical protein